MIINGVSFSKDGKDAGSNDPRDLIWSSEFNTLSIWKQEQKVLNYVSNGTGYNDVAIAHGLSFAPTFLVYCNIFGGSSRYSFDGMGSSITRCYVDNQYLRIRYTSTVTIYYYIFTDAAQVSSTQTEVDPVGKYGVKFVKDGKDAYSKYLEDITFSTDYPPLKLHNIYHIELKLNGFGGKSVLVPHGLPFTPAFIAFLDIPGQSYKERLPFNYNSNLLDVSVDSNNIWAYGDSTLTGSTDTLNYTVIVFADRAAE